jgi:hypothetical protein
MIKLLLSGFMLAPKIRAKNAKIAGPFRQARKEDRPPPFRHSRSVFWPNLK